MFEQIKKAIRPVTLLALGLGAAAAPKGYFAVRENWPRWQAAWSNRSPTQSGAELPAEAPSFVGSSAEKSAPTAPAPEPPTGVPIHDMVEVFRYDLTPGWVLDNWPRVSAGLGELSLHGYRVPLITGTGFDDVAGALTYYFTPEQGLRKITFFGTTGDPRKLTRLLVTQFGFARRLTNDPGVFLYEVPSPTGEATSALWLRPVRVVKATEPHARFEIALTMVKP